MTDLTWRHAVLIGIVCLSALAMAWLEPIPQDLSYHAFADTRSLLGIPNFLDVVSNLPFLIAGVLGLRVCLRMPASAIRLAWIALFAGVGLVCSGSAYYHWQPTNATLVWDRLPMAVGFMGLFVALLSEAVDRGLARWLLGPALVLGVGTVIYWAWTDDLRPYLWVQIVPLLTIPIVMALFRGRIRHAWWLAIALGWYLMAKITELYDVAIFAWSGGGVSGHTLKHLLAAAGCYSIVIMLERRSVSRGIRLA